MKALAFWVPFAIYIVILILFAMTVVGFWVGHYSNPRYGVLAVGCLCPL